MNFKQAINEIKQKYEISLKANNFAEIITNNMFNAYNYYFIGILEKDSNLYLTDCGNTLKVLSLNPKDLNEIINKFNAKLNEEEIVLKYNNINDVKTFINLLDELTNQ